MKNVLGWKLYETSDMQGHGLVRLGYRNESKSTTNASFATGYCTILKWLALAVLITRGRGSISPASSWCRGGFRATRKQLRYAPANSSLVYGHAHDCDLGTTHARDIKFVVANLSGSMAEAAHVSYHACIGSQTLAAQPCACPPFQLEHLY